MSDFATIAKEYVDKKIGDIDQETFNLLFSKLTYLEKKTEITMLQPNFFEDVDNCYNSNITGETKEEMMDQFVALWLNAPRPLEPRNFGSVDALRTYLENLVTAVQGRDVPAVNVIQLLHKGRMYKVISSGRTRAAAAKVAGCPLPTKILTLRT